MVEFLTEKLPVSPGKFAVLVKVPSKKSSSVNLVGGSKTQNIPGPDRPQVRQLCATSAPNSMKSRPGAGYEGPGLWGPEKLAAPRMGRQGVMELTRLAFAEFASSIGTPLSSSRTPYTAIFPI